MVTRARSCTRGTVLPTIRTAHWNYVRVAGKALKLSCPGNGVVTLTM